MADDPIATARLQAWDDAKHDPAIYRVLLDRRGLQHPLDPIPGASQIPADFGNVEPEHYMRLP